MKRILLVADEKGWAFDSHCQQIKNRLTEYRIDIAYNRQNILELSYMLNIQIARINDDRSTSISYPYIVFLDGNNKVLIEKINKNDLHQYLK
jgi:hypothetical protein